MEEQTTEVRSNQGSGQRKKDHPRQTFPLHAGTVLGSYQLQSSLGAGMLSEVFAATNLTAGKPCAVKVFYDVLDLGPVAFGRYAHEQSRLALLGHPGIVEVFYNGWHGDRPYSVLQLVRGKSLLAMVRKQAPLPLRVALPLVHELCEILSAVHDQGAHHGRLHWGQVLLCEEGRGHRMKLMDLGTHHLLPPPDDNPPGFRRLPAHAIYTAPEQDKGKPGDVRSDVYSLSVMIYEMLTGRVPFVGETYEQTMELHVNAPPPPPGALAQISEDVERALLAGLEKNPKKRTPSVQALLAALDPKGATGKHLAVPAALPPPVGPAPRPLAPPIPAAPAAPITPPGAPQVLQPEEPLRIPRNRTWLYVALGVVALACAGVLAFFLLGGEGAKKPGRRAPAAPPAEPAPPPRPPRPRAPGRPGAAPTAATPAPRPVAAKGTAGVKTPLAAAPAPVPGIPAAPLALQPGAVPVRRAAPPSGSSPSVHGAVQPRIRAGGARARGIQLRLKPPADE